MAGIQENHKNYCSMGISCTSRYYSAPASVKELIDTIKFCREKKVKYAVIGNASNTIFEKDVYDGCIIETKNLNSIKLGNDKLLVGAGLSNSKLLEFCIENSLSGLEFLAGIPGTVGGSVKGNAGSFGKEISEQVQSLTVIDSEGKIKTLKKEELNFEYRKSNIDGTISSIKLRVNKGIKEDIQKTIKNQIKTKQETQPVGKSSGCIFKNPPGQVAGKLIESCGLKGTIVGGARISKSHGNYIVNEGNATTKDVLFLMEKAKAKVKEKFKIELEEEVQIL